MSNPSLFRTAWDVFALFVIPVGGGIPGGVLLARDRGLTWPSTIFIYLLSDVALACVFEPFIKMLSWWADRSPRLAKIREAFKAARQKAIARYSPGMGHLGLVRLIGISLALDPMMGRAVALAAGYGFVGGWMIAIAGDMIFFLILMISTLSLNSILGDGTWATLIVLAAMLIIPAAWRKLRGDVSPPELSEEPRDPFPPE